MCPRELEFFGGDRAGLPSESGRGSFLESRVLRAASCSRAATDATRRAPRWSGTRAAAGVALSLRHPMADRLRRWLELFRQLIQVAPRAHHSTIRCLNSGGYGLSDFGITNSSLEVVEDLSGDVVLQATDDLSLGLPFLKTRLRSPGGRADGETASAQPRTSRCLQSRRHIDGKKTLGDWAGKPLQRPGVLLADLGSRPDLVPAGGAGSCGDLLRRSRAAAAEACSHWVLRPARCTPHRPASDVTRPVEPRTRRRRARCSPAPGLHLAPGRSACGRMGLDPAPADSRL